MNNKIGCLFECSLRRLFVDQVLLPSWLWLCLLRKSHERSEDGSLPQGTLVVKTGYICLCTKLTIASSVTCFIALRK